MTNQELHQIFAELLTLQPHGKAKEEQQLYNNLLIIAESVVVNINSIAKSLDAISVSLDSLASKHGVN